MATKNAKKTEELPVDGDLVPEEVDVTQEEAPATEVLDGELDRFFPGPDETIKLSDGTEVDIRPLKLKELFAAFKVITRGAAMSMGALSFDLLAENQDHFAETLIALLINAFPEADQEFCEFLRACVDPAAPEGGWKDKEQRMAAETHLDQLLLVNPEIDDAIDITTVVVHRESGDIQRLGKKIANAAKMFSKVAPKTPQK